MRFILATPAVILLSALTTPDAKAEHRYDRAMHRLADRIEDTADDLRDEVKRHFRRRHDYRRLLHFAEVIEDKAKHIEHVVDRHGSPRHIRADINEIDRCVHQFRNLLRHSDRRARYYGEPCRESRHVHEELHKLEDLVHTMSDVLDDLFAARHRPRPPVYVVPKPKPVVYRHHPHPGLSLGGKWGRIYFRF